MGAAYAKGFIKGLIDAGVPINMIEFEADFAPFQPTKQKAIAGVQTYQFSNDNDNIANNKALGSPYGSTWLMFRRCAPQNRLRHHIPIRLQQCR